MKYIYMALAALILSCNQANNPNYQIPPQSGSISYVVNQTDTFSWSTGNYGWMGYLDSCQPFIFSQADPGNIANGVSLSIRTDTLKMRRYSDTDAWTCITKPMVSFVNYNNKTYNMTHGDGLSYIEFTSQTDSTISGTFQFRYYSMTDTILVHNGTFTNVRFDRT